MDSADPSCDENALTAIPAIAGELLDSQVVQAICMFWKLDCIAWQREARVGISSRRFFLWTATSLASRIAPAATSKQAETVYRFATPDCEGRMSVQFFDRYSAKGFWFRDRLSTRRFCLSGQGEEGQNCLPQFSGSIAIAEYHFRSRAHMPNLLKLREQVRTIDQDSRLNPRPPFERALPLEGEVVSDIQAFGYDPQEPAKTAPAPDPWCLLRQDLYLDEQPVPFLIVHWKHTLNAITLVDVIPGDRTRLSDR